MNQEPKRPAAVPRNPLPNSLQIEKSVLGVLLKQNNMLNEVIDRLTPGCFYHNLNHAVFDAIMSLYQEGRAYDVTSVVAYLLKSNIMCDPVELFEMTELAELSSLGSWVAALDDMRKRRQIWGHAMVLAKCCETMDNDLDEAVEEAMTSIQDAMAGTADDGMVTLRKVYDNVRTTMDQNRVNPDYSRGFLLGIPEVDEYGGLGKGTLSVVGARTSHGKSALAMQWVMHNAAQGIRTAVFTLEMTSERMASRALSGATAVPSNRILSKPLDDNEYDLVASMIDTHNMRGISDRVYIDNSYSSRIDLIIAKIMRLRRRGAVDAVVVDYLQQIDKEHKSRDDNETRILGQIAHRLQKLSVTLDIPIVLLSQLNRNPVNSGDGMPRESDLRGSGEIEEAADNVILLYRPEADHSGRGFAGQYADVDPHNQALLIFAKMRNDQAGRHVFAEFDPNRVTFKFVDAPRRVSSVSMGGLFDN